MAKKFCNYQPQQRKKTKPTTGSWGYVPVDVVYIDKEKDFNPETGQKETKMFGTCTCDKWRSSDDATTFAKIAAEAKIHVDSSEGRCILRKHSNV